MNQREDIYISYQILGNGNFGGLDAYGSIILRLVHKEIRRGWGLVSFGSEQRQMADFCEHGNAPLSSKNAWNFLSGWAMLTVKTKPDPWIWLPQVMFL
jgi:hypothetical protein